MQVYVQQFCRPSALKRTVGRALYFYQQSPPLLPTSQGIQQRSVHMDQGGTKLGKGGGGVSTVSEDTAGTCFLSLTPA